MLNLKKRPLFKANNVANCITFNEFGETLKRRPVVILDSVTLDGIEYTFYLKTKTGYLNQDKDYSDIADDEARLREYKIDKVNNKVNVAIDKSDFIDPAKSLGAELVDCSKWFIMPTSQFEKMFVGTTKISMLKSRAKDAIYDRLFSLYYSQPPYLSLNKITLGDDKIEHELLYAHDDLLLSEAWSNLSNYLVANDEAVVEDKTIKFSRYLKVKGLLPQIQARDFTNSLTMIEQLSVPLYDYIMEMPKWRSNDNIAIDKESIWDKGHDYFKVEHLITGHSDGDPLISGASEDDIKQVEAILSELNKSKDITM